MRTGLNSALRLAQRHFREITPVGALLLVLVGAIGHVGWVQAQDYEVPPALKATEALPAALAKGEHYTVRDGVQNHLNLHVFEIQSDYGDYKVYGELSLRIMLREIAALDTLATVSTSTVAKEAAIDAATSTIEAAGEFFRNPGETLKGLGGGIKNRFKSVKRDVEEGVERGRNIAEEAKEGGKQSALEEAGNYYGRRFLGIDKAERRWAGKLGIDPYTENPVLRKEIERVSQVDGLSDTGTKFLVPSIPGADYIADVYKMAWFYDPRELRDINAKELATMGASPELIEAFFAVEALSPTKQTLIVSSLAEMEGVEDRSVVIEQALILEEEPDALLFVESVVMASWFHDTQAPLSKMILDTGVPVGLTQDGRVIAFSGSDYAYWTKEIADLSHSFAEAYAQYDYPKEVWTAGRATPRFIAECEKLGWTIRHSVRSEILPRIPWGVE